MSLAISLQPGPASALDWIGVDAAALLMGVKTRRIQLLCADEWAPRALARKVDGVWLIHRDAHVSFAPPVNLRQRDLEQLSEAARSGAPKDVIQTAKWRHAFVQAFAAFNFSGDVRSRFGRFLNDPRAQDLLRAAGLRRVSLATVYGWKHAYDAHGMAGLLPKYDRRGRGGSLPIGERALEHLIALALCGNRPPIAKARFETIGYATRKGYIGREDRPDDPEWHIPSLAKCYQVLRERVPEIARRAASKGRYAALAASVPKVERDYNSIAANDEWVGDERTLDVWCRVLTARGWKPVRPKMTTWLDQRSRVVVSFLIAAHADSNTILASIKRGIADYGKPLILRTDWGEDYRAATRHPKYRAFDGSRIGSVLEELGIDVRRVAPYAPWAKHIERFFDTFKDICDRAFSPFIGGSPDERHEDRNDWIKANLEKLPTLDTIEQAAAEAIAAYHGTPHGSADMYDKTPLEAMNAFRSRPVERESDAVLTHLFQRFIGPKLVRRDGVRHMSRWYGNGDARLVNLQGRRVLLAVDVDDMSRAIVCELDRKPLFEIACHGAAGLSEQDLKERIKAQKTLLKPFMEQAKAARKLFESRPAIEHIRDYRAGIAAVHGKRSPAPAVADMLKIRPALEEAIASAEPTPIEADATVIRTGTDDLCEINVLDMLAGDGPEIRPLAPIEDDGEQIDFFGIDADPLEELP